MRVSLTLSLGIAALVTGAAHAHTRLVSANPMPNTTVRQAPQQISITFNEPVLAKFVSLTVTGPDGQRLHVAGIQIDPKTRKSMSSVVHGGGRPGVYRVDWSAAGSDMHKMTGSYSFTVRP